MKKKLLFVAMTVLALASCSSDETVAVKQDSPISFRPFIEGVTRTANGPGLKETPWETGDKLYVYADFDGAKLFQDEFVKEATGGFNSTAKHYWPSGISSTKKVTFTAFWGAAQKTWATSNDENQLNAKYTVDNDVTKHMDLLIAKKEVSAKPAGGVELNFRHMLSQIAVKVRNTEANMKITVTGVRIGYAAKAGTFTYSGGVTDTKTVDDKNSGTATLVPRANWTIAAGDDATATSDFRFDQDVTLTLTGSTFASDFTNGFTPYIMMPQQLTAASAYSANEDPGAVTSATDPTLTGAYIALKMAIEDKTTAAPILAEQWCYWPIGTEWKPGYKYTYTIDAGEGGYQPTDQNDDKTTLDPVFDNSAYIWFSPDCTIDVWVADYAYVPEVPAVARDAEFDFVKDVTENISLPAGANGTYTIKINLASGPILTATADNNFTITSVGNQLVDDTHGQYTLEGTLDGNLVGSKISTIIITSDKGTSTDPSDDETMTIKITQAAP